MTVPGAAMNAMNAMKMKTNRPRVTYRSVIFLCGITFIGIAVDFALGLNFWPDHLTQNHPLSAAVKYYRLSVPDHLAREVGAVNRHIALGLLLLVLGLFQLSESFRARHVRLHRAMGVTYMGVGAATAALGVFLSQHVVGGLITQTAVVAIAALWYFTAAKSVYYVLKKQYKVHHRWVARNYFLVVATGLARPCMVLINWLVPGQRPEMLFPASFWLGLVAAMVLSQWYVEKYQAPRVRRAQALPAAAPASAAASPIKAAN